MSLKVDKDNIYVMVNRGHHDLSEKIDDFMDNEFTIFIRTKILKEKLNKGDEHFIFSRNGQHSGLSVCKHETGSLAIKLTYWIVDTKGVSNYVYELYELPSGIEDNFNDYVIICDDTIKTISLFLNGDKKTEINYLHQTKHIYDGTFMWLGCGSMMIEEKYAHIGAFEYELLFCSDKSMDISEITYIAENYKKKYISFDLFEHLPTLTDNIPYKESFKIFVDFDYRNKYKIWNMVNNYNNLQLYIKDNIYF